MSIGLYSEIQIGLSVRRKNLERCGRDKLAAILQTMYFDRFSSMNNSVLFQILLLNYLHKGPIRNKPILVVVIGWHRVDDKAWPQPMITQFTDISIHQHAF